MSHPPPYIGVHDQWNNITVRPRGTRCPRFQAQPSTLNSQPSPMSHFVPFSTWKSLSNPSKLLSFSALQTTRSPKVKFSKYLPANTRTYPGPLCQFFPRLCHSMFCHSSFWSFKSFMSFLLIQAQTNLIHPMISKFITADPPASAAPAASPPNRPSLPSTPTGEAGGPAPWETFSFFHPELRVQTAALQPLTRKIQKNCRNFSFVYGLPPIAMDYHGAMGRQSSGKASQPECFFPSPAWGRRLLSQTARLPSRVLPGQ